MIRLFGLAGLVFLLFCASVALSLYLQGVQNAGSNKNQRSEKDQDLQAKTAKEAQQAKSSTLDKDPNQRDSIPAKGGEGTGLTSIFGDGKKTSSGSFESGMVASGQADPRKALRDRQMEWIQLDLRGEQMILERLQKQLEEENKVLLERLDRYEKWQKQKEKEEKKSPQPILNPNPGRPTQEAEVPSERTGTSASGRSSFDSERDEAIRFRQVASIYESMAPDHAAKILTQMADSGNLDMAAQIIATIKDRQAARILSEMHDPALGAQLLERVKTLRQSQPQNDASRIRDRLESRTGR